MPCHRPPLRRVLPLALLLFAAACGSSPTSPVSGGGIVSVPSPFLGTWKGTINDDAAGQGALQILIDNSVEVGIGGTWTATYAASVSSGKLDNAQPPLSFWSATCVPTGAIALTLALDGDHMTGTYVAFGCGPLTKGTVDLKKQ